MPLLLGTDFFPSTQKTYNLPAHHAHVLDDMRYMHMYVLRGANGLRPGVVDAAGDENEGGGGDLRYYGVQFTTEAYELEEAKPSEYVAHSRWVSVCSRGATS